MSVPKKKRTSSSKKRRQSHSALKKVDLFSCPQCKGPVKPHHACAKCGTYKGRQAVNIKFKNKKDKK